MNLSGNIYLLHLYPDFLLLTISPFDAELCMLVKDLSLYAGKGVEQMLLNPLKLVEFKTG